MSNIFDEIVGNLNNNFTIEDDFKNKKNKKKKINKKNNISKENNQKSINQEGVEIVERDIPSRVKYRNKTRTHKKVEQIKEWTARDFVLYIRKLYYNKYMEDWGLQIARACIDFKEIEETLEEIFNVADPRFTKKYIDFFFEYWVDILVSKYKNFFLTFLEKTEVLESYHDYIESLKDGSLDMVGNIKLKNKVKEKELSNELIEASYFIGSDNLVFDYGIILSINWLILYKKIDKQKAIKEVLEVCKKEYKKGLFNIIEKQTEKFSPYPDWFIIKKIGPKVKAKIEFNNLDSVNDKYNFIKK